MLVLPKKQDSRMKSFNNSIESERQMTNYYKKEIKNKSLKLLNIIKTILIMNNKIIIQVSMQEVTIKEVRVTLVEKVKPEDKVLSILEVTAKVVL